MEYIIVKVKQGDQKPSVYWISKKGTQTQLSVIINGEVNGNTGKLLQIEAGYLEVSVCPMPLTSSETVKLNLSPNSTYVQKPKEVVINVTDTQA